jgi:serine/threonine-protein kinase
MIGTVIDDRYELRRLLGEGAMGSVYEAVHVNTGRRVAMKLIQQVALSDADIFARFEREAKVAGAIDSRHVVGVFDSGRDKASGLPYMAMELLRGEDLGSYLQRKGVLPVELAVRIVCQAALGLSKAHAAGVVHRDVKPANLFLSVDEDALHVTVKVLDFGIAKLRPFGGAQVIALTQTGKLLGTPRYMSPEQAQGEREIDARTDVWSLGSVLYEALTGRPPHDEPDHLGKLIFSICSVVPPSPRSLRGEVPEDLDRVVMRAISTRREDRHHDAEELLADLERLHPLGADLTSDALGLRVDRDPRQSLRTSQRLRPAPAGQSAASSQERVVVHPPEEIGVASTLFATGGTVGGDTLPPLGARRWLLPVVAATILAGGGGAYLAVRDAATRRGDVEVASSTSAPALESSTPLPTPSTAPSPPEPVASVAPERSAFAPGSAIASAGVVSSTASRPGTPRPAAAAPAAPAAKSGKAVGHTKVFE